MAAQIDWHHVAYDEHEKKVRCDLFCSVCLLEKFPSSVECIIVFEPAQAHTQYYICVSTDKRVCLICLLIISISYSWCLCLLLLPLSHLFAAKLKPYRKYSSSLCDAFILFVVNLPWMILCFKFLFHVWLHTFIVFCVFAAHFVWFHFHQSIKLRAGRWLSPIWF